MLIALIFAVSITNAVFAGKVPIAVADGGVGVDFLGFKASAGIGGDGTLQAHAGTPWGAEAGAGLEGEVAGGGAYAGATAGGGVGAEAGLEGGVSGGGSYGGSYGGVAIAKEKYVSKGISGGFAVAPVATYTKNVQVIKKPAVVTEVVVSKPEPPPITTVIQKTVIPNYEKKTIKVPSYEEKIVRVPTVVEKEIWVPAAPTIIEKEIQVPQPAPPTVVQTVETVPVFYKTRFRKRPLFFRKHFSFGGGYGYGGGYAGGVGSSAGGSIGIAKTYNPQLYNDIINIPVSTLGAVSKLLTGISSGVSAGGSFGVSKSIGVSKSFGAAGSASVYR